VLFPLDVPSPFIAFPFSDFHKEDELVATSASPWSTISLYYDGPVPLRRQPEQQAVVLMLRVKRDLVPWFLGSVP
jgi:hypothetical protein